jgi:hypothetical protein
MRSRLSAVTVARGVPDRAIPAFGAGVSSALPDDGRLDTGRLCCAAPPARGGPHVGCRVGRRSRAQCRDVRGDHGQGHAWRPASRRMRAPHRRARRAGMARDHGVGVSSGARTSPARIQATASGGWGSRPARFVASRRREVLSFDGPEADPPQSFTFGGVIAHVITYSAYHREVLIRSLAELGVHDIDPGDPMEWERLRQADRPRPAE